MIRKPRSPLNARAFCGVRRGVCEKRCSPFLLDQPSPEKHASPVMGTGARVIRGADSWRRRTAKKSTLCANWNATLMKTKPNLPGVPASIYLDQDESGDLRIVQNIPEFACDICREPTENEHGVCDACLPAACRALG